MKRWKKWLGIKEKASNRVSSSGEQEEERARSEWIARRVADWENIRSRVTNGYWWRDLGLGLFFVSKNRSNACWLYNGQTRVILPLVDYDGSVLFLEKSDLEAEAVELINKECPRYMMCACFGFRVFPFKDGKANVEWTVQPDGMYWADEDGYGMTDDEAINLYGQITPEGKPIGSFKLERD